MNSNALNITWFDESCFSAYLSLKFTVINLLMVFIPLSISSMQFDQFDLNSNIDQNNIQEYVESHPPVIDLTKRAWNSGFFGGLGKRGWNGNFGRAWWRNVAGWLREETSAYQFWIL